LSPSSENISITAKKVLPLTVASLKLFVLQCSQQGLFSFLCEYV